MNKSLKRWIVVAMMMAIAIVLSYLESFIPVFIPGVKLGLANAIVLIMLYEFKYHEAFIVDLLRILLVSLIRGTFLEPSFMMSISGGMLSFLVMFIFTRFKFFSPIGVSVLSSIFHSIGQILMAIVILGTDKVIYYLPFIGLLSLLTGILSGLVVRTYLKRSITNRFIN